MTHQISLSEEDYATLAAAAAQRGYSIERLVHDAIQARYMATTQQIGSYQYPTGKPLSEEEEEEMESLAQEIGEIHPWASEIVIEDRGPR